MFSSDKKPIRFITDFRRFLRIRRELPPGFEKEFEEYTNIESIDRLQVAAWIGFFMSICLFPLDFSRMDEFDTKPIYRQLFYLHFFGLLFLIPAISITFNKARVKATRLSRGIHIWDMVIMSFIYLFGMSILVFIDRDGLVLFLGLFIYIRMDVFNVTQ